MFCTCADNVRAVILALSWRSILGEVQDNAVFKDDISNAVETYHNDVIIKISRGILSLQKKTSFTDQKLISNIKDIGTENKIRTISFKI